MSINHVLGISVSPSSGALDQSSLLVEDVHAFEVESQADERPFASHGFQAAQGKLSKAEDLFDNTNDRLYGTFTQAIDLPTNASLELVGHLDNRAGIERVRVEARRGSQSEDQRIINVAQRGSREGCERCNRRCDGCNKRCRRSGLIRLRNQSAAIYGSQKQQKQSFHPFSNDFLSW